MVKYAVFKKTRTKRQGLKRTLVLTGTGKSVKDFIQRNKRAGVFTIGNFVVFRIVKNKKAFKIDGILVAKRGTPFKN